MSAFETYEHAGLKIELFYDDSGCGDPRECDNLAHLYCWHPDYVLGDEQFRNASGRGSGDNYHDTQEDAYKHCRAEGATVIMPLFLYDHSGITISAGPVIEKLTPADVSTRNVSPFDSAGWDTSWVGFAYATEARRKELGVKRSRAEVERQIRNEVEEYDKYLRGEVYGYVITGEYDAVLDSCWGFLGYAHVTETANEQAEWFAQAQIGDELNRLPVPAGV